jgi:UDP-N-acetylmuramate: L-alanyl-gamma-D-glutamyl-meso-diaminopimelate ligase
LYKPDIAILNGIAWDHMNVFPSFANYVEQFRIFAENIEDGGILIYFEGDQEVKKIAKKLGSKIKKIPYNIHAHEENSTGFYATTGNRLIPLKIFGKHNMQNLSAAKKACLVAGIKEDDFYRANRKV